MIPKCIGGTCYILILISVILFIVTLAASQNFLLLYFSESNALNLQGQILISFSNCVITVACSIAILHGKSLGRQLWHSWAVIYFFINTWQLHERIYLIPGALVLLLTLFLLYSKPAQAYFAAHKKIRPNGKRVDNTLNIFEE
jgi:hypothetical protein